MTHTSLRVFAFAVKVSSFAGPVVISMVAVGPAAASLAAPCVDATAKAPLKPLLQRKAIGSCLFDSGNVEHRVVWCLVSADSWKTSAYQSWEFQLVEAELEGFCFLTKSAGRIECKMSINLTFGWGVQHKRLKTQRALKQDTVRAPYLHWWYPILTLRASEAKSPLAPMKRKGACQCSKCKDTEEIDACPSRTLLFQPYKRYQVPNWLLRVESRTRINN